MDIPKPPYSKELIATSEIIRKTISPTLAIVNEMNPVSETIRNYMEQNSILNSNYLLDNPFMKVVEERNRALAKMVPSSVLAIRKGLDLPSVNITNQIIASIAKTDFSNIIQPYKSILADLPKYDFRIGVATQELEQIFSEEPQETSEKLLFEETSEPSNELEAQFFDILNQQREVLNDSISLFEEINAAKNKDVTEKPSNEEHDSPAFYKDKMWYAEEIASNLLSLVISAIFAKTIGVDPTNTIGFVLLLGCLLRFIKPKL
ncbi:hypothetical protein P7D86_12730 [Enterococcus avium]|uniref:hypothetical protein n=1 Tax=Enterococcus avium TaxID=33945 RepID=UPI00288FCEB1|nr:hypothetical protein [Enterococcus avium]MDT2427694.1 hypothetical protein [Enterococcus avium]